MRKESGYKTTLKEIFDGSVLTKGFLQRNAGMLLILVVCILVYIGNHYSVIMSLNQIDKLKTQLYDVKYEALTRSSELMHESRQSRIRLRVQEQGLGLEDALTPPYKIDIKE
ncbi:MAG: FtsL-like putative cell division protein [Bacteroidales bacterium]|nr:FtsL-like putative cell division protein [Bacteroidales bacterium]MDD4770485.1 FtsL-like putative cell division protein [Bacteroidales bacterium]